jgi:hypothetical protein
MYYRPAPKKWENIPIIRVKTMLEKMKWFHGTCSHDAPVRSEKFIGKTWEQMSEPERTRYEPEILNVIFPYKDVSTHMCIEFRNRDDFPCFEIGVLPQTHISHRPSLTKTFSCEEAVNAVRKQIGEIVPQIEKAVEKREKEELEKKRIAGTMRGLGETIGVNLIPGDSLGRCKDTQEYVYENCPGFTLRLRLDQSYEPPLFVITEIGGVFTDVDIKRFCQTLASSTTAVARRFAQ